MKLYKEILSSLLEKEDCELYFPNLHMDANAMIESLCYQSMKEIKQILEDDQLSDEDCFWKIEAIVRVFEQAGSNGGGRHDF